MKRAVVLGGSFAGLLAARVLSDFAEEVVVVEPDLLGEDGDGTGPGAPHRRQLHALLAMGHTRIEDFFPGITREMVAGGARLGRGDEVRFYVDGALKAPVDDVTMLGASRPFIEAHVRRRVMGLGNVRPERATGRGLLLKGGRAVGVRLAAAGATAAEDTDHSEYDVRADLVVDAMGRSSRLGTWLAAEGWGQAPVDRMRVDLGYATARFTRGSELPGTVIAHSTPGPAGDYQPVLCEPGALAAAEDGTWSVVLAGYAGHRPGRDRAEFLARMRRCVAPLREVAERCEMTGEVEPFHFRESRRRRFADLTDFPGGLVVLGDAMATVNPVYGQGLTLAALQASSLHVHLRSGVSPHDPAWGYFRRAAVVVDAAWQLSTTADLAQPHVTGPYPRGYRFLRWAGDRITTASVRDSQVNQTYLDVVHMRAHPRALTGPRVLARTARVLWGS
ncbi:FAD-dependent oxidoreductase [Streptomyces sp. NPDC059695]|uniref:FAD-dependent oxidoreductase n=1 Tax=Streptomyces sp. NPDC059695 TaxID=3346910 RepID=UPI003692A447